MSFAFVLLFFIGYTLSDAKTSETRGNKMSNVNLSDQFDNLAPLYEGMMAWPFRKEIETPALLEKVGNISGLSIFDFGCGPGHYSRLLKSQGAGRVVGYDAAGGMLDYARARESQQPQGIEYCSSLEGLEGQFDLVLGVYVLPYASTEAELIQMAASMVKLLRSGGRLLTLPLSPHYAPQEEYYAPCGFRLTSATPHQEGTPVVLHLPDDDKPLQITAWYWSHATLNRALEMAGLCHISWSNPQPPNPVSDHLTSYLEKPHSMLVEGYYQKGN
jgi:SAM-dependent methyltransferase